MISFIIYWLLSLPTVYVPIHKLRYYFMAKVGPDSLSLLNIC